MLPTLTSSAGVQDGVGSRQSMAKPDLQRRQVRTARELTPTTGSRHRTGSDQSPPRPQRRIREEVASWIGCAVLELPAAGSPDETWHPPSVCVTGCRTRRGGGARVASRRPRRGPWASGPGSGSSPSGTPPPPVGGVALVDDAVLEGKALRPALGEVAGDVGPGLRPRSGPRSGVARPGGHDSLAPLLGGGGATARDCWGRRDPGKVPAHLALVGLELGEWGLGDQHHGHIAGLQGGAPGRPGCRRWRS